MLQSHITSTQLALQETWMSFTRANTCANIDDVHGQGSPSVAKRGRDSRKPPGALGDITNFVHVKEKTPPAPPVPNDSQDEKGSSSSLAASSAVVLDPPTALKNSNNPPSLAFNFP